MPKAKTRKIVLKRFKITKSGKIVRKASKTSHLNRKDDSSTRNRKKRDLIVTNKKVAKKLKKMIVN
jgi:large subunit ribosomal protein L35